MVDEISEEEFTETLKRLQARQLAVKRAIRRLVRARSLAEKIEASRAVRDARAMKV